jgi:hypothetical protein
MDTIGVDAATQVSFLASSALRYFGDIALSA